MANTFENIQSKAYSLYNIASNLAESAFDKVQEVLPALTKTDAKTMAFGAAFFGSLYANFVLTTLSTLGGAFGGNSICSLASSGMSVFNEQSSPIKLYILASAIASLVVLRLANVLSNTVLNTVLKPIAVASVGFYTGLVLGRSR